MFVGMGGEGSSSNLCLDSFGVSSSFQRSGRVGIGVCLLVDVLSRILMGFGLLDPYILEDEDIHSKASRVLISTPQLAKVLTFLFLSSRS